MEPYIGQVTMFGGNFAPANWAFCDGRLLQVTQYDALFSIIGTVYGGDGRTTFALPDLRGRIAIGAGSGAGLSPINLGEKGGEEKTELTEANLPSHNHEVIASLLFKNEAGNTGNPEGGSLAVAPSQIYKVGSPTAGATFNSATLSGTTASTGSNTKFDNLQPFQVCNYIICLEGIYPTRE